MSVEYQTDAVMETSVEEPPIVSQKKKREGVKMTDKQKADLNKHMEKLKKGGMTLTGQRSDRMRMMGQLRKDEKMTVTKAHKSLYSVAK